MDRIQIEIKLNRGRADALEALVAMEDVDLRAPRTRSEHDPDSWWSYADHFIHTTLIERRFNEMIRRHLRGEQGMDRELVDETGAALRPMADIMASVHALTESWKVEQEGKSIDELVRIGLAVRSETLALLAELDDEQLSSTIPGAPWADGTVGGIMAVHTDPPSCTDVGHSRSHPPTRRPFCRSLSCSMPLRCTRRVQRRRDVGTSLIPGRGCPRWGQRPAVLSRDG